MSSFTWSMICWYTGLAEAGLIWICIAHLLVVLYQLVQC
jgi:hypothetical protein